MKGEKPATELGSRRWIRGPASGVAGADPYFLALLAADNNAIPVHRATVEKYGEHWAEPGKMVSDGAYVLTEWAPQKQVVLTRNPNYYGNAGVKIDKVIFYPITSPADELKLFKAGKLDMTAEVPQEQVKWISLTIPRNSGTSRTSRPTTTLSPDRRAFKGT